MSERLYGSVDILLGPMCAGKSRELATTLVENTQKGIAVQAFRPSIDTRNGSQPFIESRAGNKFPAEYANDSTDLVGLVRPDTYLVGIDELHLWDQDIADAILSLRERGHNILAVGLLRDFRAIPYDHVCRLLGYATTISMLTAICTYVLGDQSKCEIPATETQRFTNGMPSSYHEQVVVIGDISSDDKPVSHVYTPRCVVHHEVPDKPLTYVAK